MKKIFIFLLVLGLVLFGGVNLVKIVRAADTTLGATITSGGLTLSNSTATSATFASKTVSASEQTTPTSIGDTNAANSVGIEISDLRGSGVGWAATMTSTNLTTKGSAMTLAGTNLGVGFSGTYDGINAIYTTSGLFTVEITTGGTVGVAIFKWTDPLGVATTNVTTASTVSLSNNISVTFDPATYMIGDKWSVGVDVFPYTGLTVTPSTIYAESGTLDGVTAGGSGLLSGSGTTSDAKSIMTATAGNGTGIYWQDLNLDLNIHANSMSGDFGAVVVLTVS